MRRFFEFSLASGLEGLEQRLSLCGSSGTASVLAQLYNAADPPIVPDPEPESELPVYPTPEAEPDPGDFPGFPPPPVYPPPPIGGPIGPA